MESLAHAFMFLANVVSILAIMGATALLVEMRFTFINIQRNFGESKANWWFKREWLRFVLIVLVLTVAVVDLLVM